MKEIDIWRTAQLLIKQHGIRAAFFAAQRADELLVSGDHVGCSIWIRISRAIGDLGRQKPREMKQ